eukprot:jgi/Botrbrau1/13874/Bobra.0056s0106.1
MNAQGLALPATLPCKGRYGKTAVQDKGVPGQPKRSSSGITNARRTYSNLQAPQSPRSSRGGSQDGSANSEALTERRHPRMLELGNRKGAPNGEPPSPSEASPRPATPLSSRGAREMPVMVVAHIRPPIAKELSERAQIRVTASPDAQEVQVHGARAFPLLTSVHQCCTPVLCTVAVHLSCAPVLCTLTVHRYCVHSYWSTVLCTGTVHLCCAPGSDKLPLKFGNPPRLSMQRTLYGTSAQVHNSVYVHHYSNVQRSFHSELWDLIDEVILGSTRHAGCRSGKTFTMGTGNRLPEGGQSQASEGWPHAVVPNLCSAIFAKEKSLRLDGASTEIACSFMEIQETRSKAFRDLLDKSRDAQKSTVEALRRVKVINSEELEVGSPASTPPPQGGKEGKEGSVPWVRSSPGAGEWMRKRGGTMYRVGGSERLDKAGTGSEAKLKKEAIAINQGLFHLGLVVKALEQGSRHVPYREHPLTMVLRDSLGGTSRTLMIACVSPVDTNVAESVNTLEYATAARKVKNKPTVNRSKVSELREENELLKEQNRQLQQESASFRARILDLESGSEFHQLAAELEAEKSRALMAEEECLRLAQLAEEARHQIYQIKEGKVEGTEDAAQRDGFRPDQTFRRSVPPAFMPSLLPAMSGINIKDVEGWQLPRSPRLLNLEEGPNDCFEDLETLVSQDLDQPTWHALKVLFTGQLGCPQRRYTPWWVKRDAFP